MKKYWIVYIIFLLVLTGCQTPTVLTGREQYYYIPKGSTINGIIIKGQPAKSVIVDHGMWVIDSSYLAELQKAANMKVFKDIK